jgi:hypothetical protein
MYYELAEKTKDGSQPSARLLWLPSILFFILMAGVQIFLDTELSGRHFTKELFSTYIDEIDFWASLFSGLLVGVCTGLFVSKLTSRLIDLPLWTLVLLIFYSIQQPLFAALTINDPLIPTTGLPLAVMALYGKCLLIFVIEFARAKYRILYFMWRAPQIDEEERTLRTYDEFVFFAQKTFDPLEIRVVTTDQTFRRNIKLSGVQVKQARRSSKNDICNIIVTAEDTRALMEVSEWITDRWNKRKPNVARVNNQTVSHADQVPIIINDYLKKHAGR